MPHVRRATAEDEAFLWTALALAADWRPGVAPRPVSELMAEAGLAHYVAGWPRDGDVGVVADDGRPLGAAWWRFFAEDDPGYGFVDAATPEVAVAVVPEARGQGLGTILLEALIAAARRLELPALSLSVEQGNPAMHLYVRLGFTVVARVDGARTMVLQLGYGAPRATRPVS